MFLAERTVVAGRARHAQRDDPAVNHENRHLFGAVGDIRLDDLAGEGVKRGADLCETGLQRLLLYGVPGFRPRFGQQHAAIEHRCEGQTLLQAGKAHQLELFGGQLEFDLGQAGCRPHPRQRPALRVILRRGRGRPASGASYACWSQRRPVHRGMFPCFLGGRRSRLFCSISNALIRRGRDSCGSITSSTKPLAAAMYGLAKRAR